MRNFKKIVLLLAALLCMELAAEFCLEPVTYGYFLECDLRNLKKQGRKPDVVFIGNSRIYRSLVPEIFDRSFDDGSHCAINAGTGSQTLLGSYYYLKDLTGRYPVKYVVLGLSHTNFLEQRDDSLLVGLEVWERIRSWPVKLEYLRKVFSWQQLPYLLKSYRYRGYADDIPQTLRFKLAKETRNGIDVREGEHYADRGYIWTQGSFADGETGIGQSAVWEADAIEQESFYWLEQITRLCKERGIELVFVSAPVTLSLVYGTKGYENGYETIADWADSHEIPYFDLNLLRDRRKLLPDSVMLDHEHVCGTGAARTTEIFCEIWNASREKGPVEERFYGSLEEMQKEIHEVVACDFHTEPVEGSADRVCLAQSLQEDGAKAEFAFWIAGQDGVWELLQPYGPSDRCTIDGKWFEETVTMRVCARLAGSAKEWEARIQKERTPWD